MSRRAESSDEILLTVRARPGARREGIVEEQDGVLKVAVQAPPDKGKANEALVRVLAEALGLRRGAVALVRGETSRDKVFRLRGITLEQVRARLGAVQGGARHG